MYQIKVLTNEEFDNVSRSDLRYSNVDETNLGFADPQKGIAYIRHSASPDLNKYLISHEFDHLIEDEGTDEDEFGIRHKKKRNFWDWASYFTWNPVGVFSGGKPAADMGMSDRKEAETKANESAMQVQQEQQQEQQRQQDAFQSSIMNQFYPSSNISNMDSNKVQSSNLVPSSVGGEVSGSINQGSLNSGSVNNSNSNLPPEFMERIKGFFSGRIPF